MSSSTFDPQDEKRHSPRSQSFGVQLVGDFIEIGDPEHVDPAILARARAALIEIAPPPDDDEPELEPESP